MLFGSGVVAVTTDHVPGSFIIKAESPLKDLVMSSAGPNGSLEVARNGKPTDCFPRMRTSQLVIAPVGSVENSMNRGSRLGNVGKELDFVNVIAPSVKLNDKGNIVTKERFGGRGCARV